jgi:hypothetical protein
MWAMRDYLLGVATGATVLVLGYLFKRFWQDNPIRRYRQRKREELEADRLLWAIQDRARGNLDAAVSIEKVVEQAQVENPAPVLERLERKGQIIPLRGHSRSHIQITRDGIRAAARQPPERRWWEFSR